MATNTNPLPVARSTIEIGSVTTTYDLTTMAGDTYVPISGVRNFPGFADDVQEITSDHVDDGRTRSAKGTRKGQRMEIVCTRLSKDPGQIACKAAIDSDESFNLKITNPNGKGGVDTFYFTGLVMQKTHGNGGPNDAQTTTIIYQPQEAPIEDLAA